MLPDDERSAKQFIASRVWPFACRTVSAETVPLPEKILL